MISSGQSHLLCHQLLLPRLRHLRHLCPDALGLAQRVWLLLLLLPLLLTPLARPAVGPIIKPVQNPTLVSPQPGPSLARKCQPPHPAAERGGSHPGPVAPLPDLPSPRLIHRPLFRHRPSLSGRPAPRHAARPPQRCALAPRLRRVRRRGTHPARPVVTMRSWAMREKKPRRAVGSCCKGTHTLLKCAQSEREARRRWLLS